MTTDPDGRSRWTKEDATPGEDPREIDREQSDPERAERLRKRRHVTHAEQETDPEETGGNFGTSTTTHDPTERT